MSGLSVYVTLTLLQAVLPVPDQPASDESDPSVIEAAILAEDSRLFAIIFSILRDPIEAQDALQDVMVKAWRSSGDLRDPAKLKPWITRICVNHCLRRRMMLRRWATPGDHELERQAASRHLSENGRNLDLDRAYSRLSVRQRAVITLHYQHGYSLVECGQLMGCRPGTVASHLSRALANLRKELSDA